MINMDVQRFAAVARAVKYDGTNWTELTTEYPAGYRITTDLGGGVLLLEHDVFSPFELHPGDWYMTDPSPGFWSAADFAARHSSLTLALPS